MSVRNSRFFINIDEGYDEASGSFQEFQDLLECDFSFLDIGLILKLVEQAIQSRFVVVPVSLIIALVTWVTLFLQAIHGSHLVPVEWS